MRSTVLAVLLVMLTEFGVTNSLNDGDVLELTKESFQKAIEDNNHLAVYYYSRQCLYCSLFAYPEYIKTAKMFQERGKIAKFARMDMTDDTEFTSENDLINSPVIKYYQYGKVDEPDGLDIIIGTIIKRIFTEVIPIVSALHTMTEVGSFVKQNDLAVVGFFQSAESDAVEEFMSVCKRNHHDFSFGIVIDQRISSELDIHGDAVVVFRKADHKRAVLTENFTQENILGFVQSKSVGSLDSVKNELMRYKDEIESRTPEDSYDHIHYQSPHVMTLDSSNFSEVAYHDKKDVLVYFRFSESKFCDEACQILQELGDMHRDDPSVVIAQFDCYGEDFLHCRELKSSRIKLFKRQWWSQTEVKHFNGDISVTELSQFLRSMNSFERCLYRLLMFSSLYLLMSTLYFIVTGNSKGVIPVLGFAFIIMWALCN